MGSGRYRVSAMTKAETQLSSETVDRLVLAGYEREHLEQLQRDLLKVGGTVQVTKHALDGKEAGPVNRDVIDVTLWLAVMGFVGVALFALMVGICAYGWRFATVGG